MYRCVTSFDLGYFTHSPSMCSLIEPPVSTFFRFAGEHHTAWSDCAHAHNITNCRKMALKLHSWNEKPDQPPRLKRTVWSGPSLPAYRIAEYWRIYQRTVKYLNRLWECACLSGPFMFACGIRTVFLCYAPNTFTCQTQVCSSHAETVWLV